jgi:hypothetical protein
MGLVLEIATSNEWHILKGDAQYGPYSYEDMIVMLQNKTLFDFDLAWAPHMEKWAHLADLPEFSADRLHRIVEKSKGSEVFQRRTATRAVCSIPAYAHNDQRMWNGTVENLSLGGALIRMENPILLPGDFVTIHLRKSPSIETAFNVTAEILTKRLTKQRIKHDTSIYYAVKFVDVQPFGTEQIKQILKTNNKE